MMFVFVWYKQRTHKYCVCTLCAYACTACICVYCVHMRVLCAYACTVCICVYCVHLHVLCAFACAVYRGKHGQSIHKANKVCVFYSQRRVTFCMCSFAPLFFFAFFLLCSIIIFWFSISCFAPFCAFFCFTSSFLFCFAP